MRCPTCDGRHYLVIGFGVHEQWIACPDCRGLGRVPFGRWLALRLETWRAAVAEWLAD